LHNTIIKTAENSSQLRGMLGATAEQMTKVLVSSFLGFCEMTRLCGNADDLNLALAKTGFLEQRFENTVEFSDVYPAVLAERADILWSKGESTEAVQTIRSIVTLSRDQSLSFGLVPKEIIIAKLVSPTL